MAMHGGVTTRRITFDGVLGNEWPHTCELSGRFSSTVLLRATSVALICGTDQGQQMFPQIPLEISTLQVRSETVALAKSLKGWRYLSTVSQGESHVQSEAPPKRHARLHSALHVYDALHFGRRANRRNHCPCTC
jgi:hypothetical protein